MTVHDVAELRGQLRQSAAEDRAAEDWLLVAFPEAEAVVELLPLLALAEEGSPARRLLAEHIRYRLGVHIAAALELLDTLERTYGLDGPIADDRLSNAEAAAAIRRLTALVRGGEE